MAAVQGRMQLPLLLLLLPVLATAQCGLQLDPENVVARQLPDTKLIHLMGLKFTRFETDGHSVAFQKNLQKIG